MAIPLEEKVCRMFLWGRAKRFRDIQKPEKRTKSRYVNQSSSV